MYSVGIFILVTLSAVFARPQFNEQSSYAGNRFPVQTIPHTDDKWPARPEDYSSTTYAPLVPVQTASTTSRPAFTNRPDSQTNNMNQQFGQQSNFNQNQNQQFPNRVTLELDQNGNVVGASGGNAVSFNNGEPIEGANNGRKPIQLVISIQQG